MDPLAAIGASLRFAVVAALIATTIGFLAATAINGSPRLGKLLDAGLMLPLGTSAVTIGLGMLITFDTPPVDWRARWWLVPLGHALVAVPFVVRAMLAVLRTIPADLRAAASTLGATPIQAWWQVDARAPAPAAAGRGRVFCGNLARRVRGHHDPESLWQRDAADCHRPLARARRGVTASSGVRDGNDSVGVDDGDRDGLW